MPIPDIKENIIDAEIKTQKVIKKIDIKKELLILRTLVETGSKYYSHMSIRDIIDRMLDIKNRDILLNYIFDIMDICNNPKDRNLKLPNQLKQAKKIQKLLKS